jgi:coenzyme F420-dependent glucose-6-phosphate dehydrogenase
VLCSAGIASLGSAARRHKAMSAVRIGFHASHEQWSPSTLLRLVQQAEAAGFTAAMSSDHFHPWTEHGGASGFAWAWLGAALQATRLPFGVVSAPGQRYHPAVIAQAAATLDDLFPGRFWLAVGTGEFLNEHITGDGWPRKTERNARLREAADVIRALWRGDTVDHDGLVRVRAAKLFTRPRTTVPLIGAALTEATAEWMGGWADGLITAGAGHDALRRLVDAFHRGGGRGKRLVLQAAVAYGADDEGALQDAFASWPHAALSPTLLADLETPVHFDEATRALAPNVLRDKIRISSDPRRHRAWIEEDIALGFDEIQLSHVGRAVEPFIAMFSDHVLPYLG